MALHGSAVLTCCCLLRVVLNGRWTKCCLLFALCRIAPVVSQGWWGLSFGELQCGQGLRVRIFFPWSWRQWNARKTSLANQAVSRLPANAAYWSGRQQQRRMASCLPTGSLALSDVSNNSSGVAPQSGVWEAQPHEVQSCPGLCATLLPWLISAGAYWKRSS